MARRLDAYERRELDRQKQQNKERAGAVTRGELEALQGAVKKLFKRVLASKSSGLTNDDLLTTFVRPEHYEVMRLAPQLVQDCPRGEFFCHRLSGIEIWFGYNPSFAQPEYMGQYVNPGEAYAKLGDWLMWRIETGRKWGLVLATLHELCRYCKDLQTMRFFWPAIIALCSRADHHQYPKLHPDRVRDLKVPNDLPLLPVGLRQAIAETNETVAVSMLLPDDEVEQPVKLTANALPGFTTTWHNNVCRL
jgi:hypothetical protein